MMTSILAAMLVTCFCVGKTKPLFWSLWNQSTFNSVVVTAVYWSIINKGVPIDADDVFIHIMNSTALLVIC